MTLARGYVMAHYRLALVKVMSSHSIYVTTGLVLLSGLPVLVHIHSPETDICLF